MWNYAKRNRIQWKRGPGFGHWRFSLLSIPENVSTITSLRCPVKHVVSIYRYHGGHERHKKGSSLWWAAHESFSEWIRNPEGMLQMTWPFYVNFFGDGYLGDAIKNLSLIDYVLDTAHLNVQFNEKVASKHQLPEFLTHDHKTKKSPEVIPTEDDIECLKALRKDDFEICKMFGIETL
jgi:hypothetical protein